ncbi:hypothetical protein NADFUDRAFT_48449 [Nadsonia fulvescens var. elongata DSM 6958]|uniref:Uncharacterized protein n=1 Tax=Nadsonia fulvescens var. elongata DSM 6958 TaxID=857566 RepID=A0A1E3PR33_9ASCO|nr:hypothetical protein NADFUDRAFT_48449 [Nadsonia fulvescens var. elongata DSM 6958]
MDLNMNMSYAIEGNPMFSSHSGLVSPPSLSSSSSSWSTSSASSISSLSSLNSVLRFNISRGFEPEDDMEFCPALSCGRGVDINATYEKRQYQLYLQQHHQTPLQSSQNASNYGGNISPTSYNVNPYHYPSKSSYSVSPSASAAEGVGMLPRTSPSSESSGVPLIDSNGLSTLEPSSPGTPTGRMARIRRAIEIVDPSTGLKIRAK